ncbi:AbrB family transcriptional regulator [Dechloromonas sp.]|uniref:AbrB family transcriptional regulator n=1 Tax=Dechloromonas sp. TaxID=1917218 RepID=UPI00286E64B7|nr:AbrB family transcriptional regulator [Dechloromonas sp.]
MPTLPPLHRLMLRILPALLLATLAGSLAQQLHVPLPWMIGPLFTIALLRMAGARLEGPPGGRQVGQCAIGTALGLYFTPEVLGQLGRHGPAIVLMAASAVAVGLLGALMLRRWTDVSPATAFFAALPGGASEMVVLAERQGGAVDRVAAAHALRVMLVVSSVPFVLVHWSHGGDEIFRPLATAVDWWRLPILVTAALAGVLLFLRLRVANAWVLGPLACVGGLTALAIPLSGLPPELVNGGQLLLGVALGSRFSPSFFRAAPRFLGVSTLATGLALLLSGLFVWLLARFVSLPLPSLALAASPGGMAEMSITAKVMHLSVPLVTATHVLRVVLLTVCAPPLCRHFLAWQGRSNQPHSGDQA